MASRLAAATAHGVHSRTGRFVHARASHPAGGHLSCQSAAVTRWAREDPSIAFFEPNRPSYIADPYPALARLRREAPVFFSRELDAYVLTRYADCLEVLRDHERFASDTARAGGRIGDHVRAQRRGSPLGDRPLFGQSDPPDHPRLRSIINRAFTPSVVAAHRDAIAAEVERLLDAITPGEPFDFATQIAEALPVLVIGDLLGLDDGNRLAVRARASALMRAASDDRITPAQHTEAAAARDWLRAFLAGYARDEDHTGSLIAMLQEAEAEGGRLIADELLSFAVFLYSAG
ncbi:MAG: hypothetical protein O3B31_09910, partial [Chloroflexi bacterium]|nr:hypothetical protein [Chloroflexota bacterium]